MFCPHLAGCEMPSFALLVASPLLDLAPRHFYGLQRRRHFGVALPLPHHHHQHQPPPFQSITIIWLAVPLAMPDPVVDRARRNIFQMDRGQLQNLHQCLWSTRQGRGPVGELSARTLRIRATEWLLLNGLSTLHRFEEDRKREEKGEEEEEECGTCRQYRVGKAIPIYAELATMKKEDEEGADHQPSRQQSINGQQKRTQIGESKCCNSTNSTMNGTNSANSPGQLVKNGEDREEKGRRRRRRRNSGGGDSSIGCLSWCRHR